MNAEGAYIEEIILVDDSSTMENLGEKLEIALSYFKKPLVKLIRNFERMGLIQSRLAGASMAEGDILLFMDSHCECYPNWLVPLIQHVACDRTSIAVPGKTK